MNTNEIEFKKTARHLFYSFVSGSLSLFGLTNPFKYIQNGSDPEADFYNISRDWNNVGRDIYNSYEKYKSEYCQ